MLYFSFLLNNFYLIQYTVSKMWIPSDQMLHYVASGQQVCTVCISPTKKDARQLYIVAPEAR